MASKGSALKTAIKAVLALAVSAVALWWAFRDVDLAKLLEKLEDSNPLYVAVYILTFFVIHAVRVVRWGLLVRPIGQASDRAIFAAASVGIPAAVFLPLRLGEFVRPAMIARAGVPFAGAMASVVVERVADGIVNVGAFFLLLSLLPASAEVPDQLRTLSKLALVGFGAGVGFLVAAYVARRPVLAATRRILTPLSEVLAERVVGLVQTFVDGLAVLGSLRRIVAFLGLTLTYWFLMGWSTWLLATSYLPELPFLAGPFTISVVVFAVMIPAGPAFAGTLQAGFRLGMQPFGVSASLAAVVAVAAHVLQIVLLASIAGVGTLSAEDEQRSKSGAPVTPEEA